MFRWSIDESGIRNSSFGFLNLYYLIEPNWRAPPWNIVKNDKNLGGRKILVIQVVFSPFVAYPTHQYFGPTHLLPDCWLANCTWKWQWQGNIKWWVCGEKKYSHVIGDSSPKERTNPGGLEAKNWEKFYYKDSAVIFFAATEIKWVSQFSN